MLEDEPSSKGMNTLSQLQNETKQHYFFPFFLLALPPAETQPTPPYVSLWFRQWESRACTIWVWRQGGGYLQHADGTEAMTISKTLSLAPHERYTKKWPEEIFAKHITKQTPGIMSTLRSHSLGSHKGICASAAQSFITGFWSSTLHPAISTMNGKPQATFMCKLLAHWMLQVTFNLNNIVGNNQVLAFARAASLCLSDCCTQNNRADTFN